jgi:sodium/bile acid cotransporter 7
MAQVGLLAIVLVGAIHCGKYLATTNLSGSGLFGNFVQMIMSVVAIHTIALFVGQWTGRALGFAREDWIAVGFAGSQKTLMVGLHVALMVGGGLAILPMVAYHVCQLIIDTLVADRLVASCADPDA